MSLRSSYFFSSLRLFALVPLLLAALSARSLYKRRFLLHQTVSIVTLSTRLLLDPGQLPLLALSPAILLASIVISLPFISLIFHLLLIGYFGKGSDGWEWHVRPYAGWLVAAVITIWFWTWCIARDVLRVSVAGVIAAWYFLEARGDPVEVTHSALYRATGPSLGTNCLSALVMTGIQLTTLTIHGVTRVSQRLCQTRIQMNLYQSR